MEDHNSLSMSMSMSTSSDGDAQQQGGALNRFAENFMMCHRIEALACADTVDEILPKNPMSRFLRSRCDPDYDDEFDREFDGDEEYDDASLNTYGNTLNTTDYAVDNHTLASNENTFDNTIDNTWDNTLDNTLEKTLDSTYDSRTLTTNDNTYENTLDNTYDDTYDDTMRSDTFDDILGETSTQRGLLFNDDGTVEIPAIPRISFSDDDDDDDQDDDQNAVAHRKKKNMSDDNAPIVLESPPRVGTPPAELPKPRSKESSHRGGAVYRSASSSPEASLCNPKGAAGADTSSVSLLTAPNTSMESVASRLTFAPWTGANDSYDDSYDDVNASDEKFKRERERMRMRTASTGATLKARNLNQSTTSESTPVVVVGRKPSTTSRRAVDTSSMAREKSVEVVGKAIKPKKASPAKRKEQEPKKLQEQQQKLQPKKLQEQQQKLQPKQKEIEKSKTFRFPFGRSKSRIKSRSKDASKIAKSGEGAIAVKEKQRKGIKSTAGTVLVKEKRAKESKAKSATGPAPVEDKRQKESKAKSATGPAPVKDKRQKESKAKSATGPAPVKETRRKSTKSVPAKGAPASSKKSNGKGRTGGSQAKKANLPAWKKAIKGAMGSVRGSQAKQ